MKMMLSTPSTISSAVSVASAIQALGSASQSSMVGASGGEGPAHCSNPAAPAHRRACQRARRGARSSAIPRPMANDDTLPPKRPPERPKVLDIGAGDPEAPANAIPNIIAHLVETETWRNAATVIMGGLLIVPRVLGLQRRPRFDRAERGSRASRRCSAPSSKGLDVWVGEHRAEAARARAGSRRSSSALRGLRRTRAPGPAPRTCCTTEAEELGAHGAVVAVDARRRSRSGIIDRAGARARVEGCRPLRPAAALRRVPAAARPRARRRAAIRAPLSRKRSFRVKERVGPAASGRLVSRADSRRATAPPVAALAMGVEADGELATIFSPPRVPGPRPRRTRSPTTACMLTPSRFAEELIAAGVADGSRGRQLRVPRSRCAIRAAILPTGHAPTLEPAARPLTQAAALAVAARGKTARIRAARRGRRAVPQLPRATTSSVSGAGCRRTTWASIAEISATEAFAALRYFWISFAVIGGFVVLSLGAALTSATALSRLQRQFGRLQRLGAYTLERKISEGGMATIYLARHALLKRRRRSRC